MTTQFIYETTQLIAWFVLLDRELTVIATIYLTKQACLVVWYKGQTTTWIELDNE